MRLKNLKFETLPESPGVYIFADKFRAIYVGKAKNLKKRLESYFRLNLIGKTRKMVLKAKKVSYLLVNSELEALLLESALIKKYLPYYNFVAKDDNHPLYIKITDETYPRVITARKDAPENSQKVFGPFPSSRTVYAVLRTLRKIFPFSDHKPGKRVCLYHHLGLCNPCPNEITQIKNQEIKLIQQQKYLKNIEMLQKVLSRKIPSVLRNLQKEMQTLAGLQKYEEANQVKTQIAGLKYITQPIIPQEAYLQNPNLVSDLRENQLNRLRKLLNLTSLKRIECYDISHLAGTNTAASMVTFINGEPEKRFYRHFKINQAKKSDDLSALKEVAQRRIKHFDDWGSPDLIIVDGGKNQVKTFRGVFDSFKIPVIGISKSQGNRVNALIIRLRDEAHRFAQRYHHKLTTNAILKY